jgi:hypothetical protein
MSRAFHFLAATVLALATVAAGAADTRETRSVSGFRGISLAIPARLELIQGDTESFAMEGPAEDLARVEVEVNKSGVLEIYRKDRTWSSWHPKIRITVNAKNVESLGISGSGDISAKTVRSPTLTLAISGSGDIRIPAVDTESAHMSISGSGDIEVSGKARSVKSNISGSGGVKAKGLEARTVSVKIAGSGDVAVWARDSLDVTIAGAGDVRYYGDPTVDKRVVGSGSVKRLGPSPS